MNKKISVLLFLLNSAFLGASYSPAAKQVAHSGNAGSQNTIGQLAHAAYYGAPLAVAAGVGYKWYQNRYVVPEKRYESSKELLRTLSERFNPDRQLADQNRDSKHSAEIDQSEKEKYKLCVNALYLEDVEDDTVRGLLYTLDVKKSLIDRINKIFSPQIDGSIKDNARKDFKQAHDVLAPKLTAKISQIQKEREAAKTTIKWGLGITAALGAVYASIKWFWPSANK